MTTPASPRLEVVSPDQSVWAQLRASAEEAAMHIIDDYDDDDD